MLGPLLNPSSSKLYKIPSDVWCYITHSIHQSLRPQTSGSATHYQKGVLSENTEFVHVVPINCHDQAGIRAVLT